MATNQKQKQQSAIASLSESELPGLEQLAMIVNKLRRHQNAIYFNDPVDPVALGIPDYLQVIKTPMDLGTIHNKLQQGKYNSPSEVVRDVSLVWTNATTYNPPGNAVHQMAEQMQTMWEDLVLAYVKKRPSGTFPNTPTTKPTSPLSSPAKSLAQIANELVDTLQKTRDSSGRQLTELFVELPSPQDYPDYYQIIQDPISLTGIRSKADLGQYSKPEDISKDFMLMFANAQLYNITGSLVWQDAQTLRALFVKEFSKLFPAVTISSPLIKPLKRRVSETRSSQKKKRKHEDSDSGEGHANGGTSGSKNVPFSIRRKKISKKSSSKKDSDYEDESDQESEPKDADDEPMENNNNNEAPLEIVEDDSEESEDSDSEDDGKPKKKTVDLDEEVSESIIEKILADRPPKKSSKDEKEVQPSTPAIQPSTPAIQPVSDTHEYFIKWKGKSFLHSAWLKESDLKSDPLSRTKINRYWQAKQKQAIQGISEVTEEDIFPPEYCEVDRVLATKPKIDPTTGKETPYYLIKWKGLPYSESTWERPVDFNDDEKIEYFKKINSPPPASVVNAQLKPSVPSKKFAKMETSPPFKNENELRLYQLEGMNWLTYCWYERRGSILADEMGLGKTVQSITLLWYLATIEKIPGPFLIVAPLSTIGHWQRELEEWTDLNVVVYQGNKANRELTRKYEFYFSEDGIPQPSKGFKFHVLLTTYEMILSQDWMELQKIKWKVLITDEAQRLKNQASKLLTNLKMFKVEHRVLLTGTPLQNNTQELWTLLNFIEPQKFAFIKEFMSQFGQLEDSEQVAKLHAVLRPHILRRMKEHVEKSIPPKEETIVEVELTSLQKKYYRAILEKNREFLNKGCSTKNVPNLLNVVMQLRKVCNHPFLIPGVEDKEVPSGLKEDYFTSFVQSSGKMVLLDKLLPKLKEGGHKVLIFSQMMRVLDLLETYMRSRGYLYERLDGSIRGNERQASIDRFCKPGSDRFVFLLCTRAGGLGINLVAADTVVIYDSDWNPQNDIQAQARCHRIGQTQEVKVYRLITSKTYERKMFERSSKKLGLDQAVLHGMAGPTTSANKPALDKKEIDSLLKYGAFDIFRDDDKESEKRFYEEDIEQILDRSSKVVWTENSAKVMGNNTFSKATFQFNAADTQVDINDPNFWNLVLPEAKTAEKMLEKLLAGTALGTKEKKEIFLADVGELVDEVISAFQNGRPDSVSKMRSVLISLFAELRKGKILEFSKDQQRKITEWGEEVERPRRERRQISRFGGVPEYQRQPFKKEKRRRRRSHDSDQEVESGPENDADEIGEILNGWTEKERKRFHSAFMSLGPHRWNDIKARAQVDKTEQQMREYAIDFIKQCIIHADEFDRNHFIECLDVLMSHQQDQEVEIEVELQPSYTRLISKRLRAWVKNLKLIKALNEFCGPKPSMENISLARFPFRPITRWWTQEEDKSLLLGVRKYGLGAFEMLCDDPEFSFVNFSAIIAEAEEEEKKKKEQQAPDPSSTTHEVPQHPIVQEPVKQEHVKQEPMKEEPMKEEPISEAPSDPMKVDTEAIPTDPITGEVPSTAEGQDKKSKKKKKKGPKPAAEVPPVDPSTLPGNVIARFHLISKATWPSNKMLNMHFRFLMDHIRKLGEKEERKARQTEMRRREREHVWSKREQGDFRAALLTFGPGSWERIRRKAALHKTVEQIELYYQQLMRQCKDIISGNPDGEDKDDEPERYDTGSKNLPLSSMMARRLLKFMKLMDDIAERMLPNPELTDKLHKAQPLDLPSWWLSPEHDLVLLQNVSRFGIGTRKWEKFLEDKNCPFYFNGSGKAEHRKSRYKFLAAFFKDKTAVLKRLEYLRLLVLDPAACLDLHKKRGPRADSFPFITQRFTRSLSGNLTPEAKKKLEEEAMMQQDISDHVKLNLNFKTTIKDVVRDKDGKPILPIVAKGASIVNLGTIVHDRPAFHSKNYIWPVGFKSIRKLPSVKNSREYVTYASEIIDGGSAPMFQVSCVDDPTFSLQHTTSSGVWVEALKLIKKRPNVSVSGPEMYGFSDPVVKMLIQELPNAKLCSGYEWKEYHFPSLTTDLPTSVRDSSEKRVEKDSETAFDKDDETPPSTPSAVLQDKEPHNNNNNNNNLSTSNHKNDAMDIDSSSGEDAHLSQANPILDTSDSDSEGSSSSVSEDDLDVG